MKGRMAVIALATLLVAWPGAAQETRGSIEGVVKDASGAVLPGVTVEAHSPALVGTATTVTDGTGTYRFPALAPGIYEVTATLSGFQTSTTQNIQLQLGQILKIDFALKVASVSETVQVTGESPIIDVKQNAAAVSIQSDIIERIPKGRDFTSVITAAPGTNEETNAGGLQIDGASGSENRFVIDGLDTTSLRTGESVKDLPVDFVAEVQVKSSGYNAEYRATTGGVISAITKSGSNQIRGSFGTYYSNDSWSGKQRPSLRLVPSNTKLSEYITTPRDPDYSIEPVMDLGGPILRDRVWFYAGYNPRFRRHERDVVFSDTGEGATFEDPRDTQSVNYNVTAQLSSQIRARAAMSNQRATNSGGRDLPSLEPDGTSNENADLFPNPLTHNSTTDSYAGNVSWVVSPKFFVNADLGFLTYNTYGVTDTEFSDALRHTFDGSNFAFPDIPSNLQQLDNYADLPSSTRDVRDKYSRINLNLDGTYYGNFAGRHTLKAGVQFERLSNDVLTGAQAPTVSLHWDDARTTLDDPPRQVRGKYGYYTVARRFTEGKIHTNNVGLFLQDAWTLNNRLTLNLGVRADSETMPSYRPENPGLHFNLGDKIAPRLGFAYDVRGDGQWKAYGSWGMFYDISKLEMPRGAWGADRWIDYHYTLDTFDWPSISCDGPVGTGCPGTFIELADRRHVSNDRENPLIDPDLKPIRTQEFTVGVDHELSRTMSVGIRYSHKWLDRTIEDVGIQVAGVGEVFMIANPGYGIAEFTLAGTCATCPAQPPAKRVYDGVELRLRKRLSDRWSMITSYLWSRLYGNYSGLASSDENGRNSPSVDRFFDGEYMSFDQNGQPVFGRLGTDRPHQFKMQATYDFPWGTQIGVNYFLASGTPMSSTISFKSVPVFPFGRGDLGRTPVFSSTDLLIGHTFRLPGTTELNVNLNVFNLFDQDTITRYRTSRYRDDLPDLTDATFFQGFDSIAIANANPDIRPDPRFSLADRWHGERTMRVQAKFSF